MLIKLPKNNWFFRVVDLINSRSVIPCWKEDNPIKCANSVSSCQLAGNIGSALLSLLTWFVVGAFLSAVGYGVILGVIYTVTLGMVDLVTWHLITLHAISPVLSLGAVIGMAATVVFTFIGFGISLAHVSESTVPESAFDYTTTKLQNGANATGKILAYWFRGICVKLEWRNK